MTTENGFLEYNLSDGILKALEEMKFATPTEIQKLALPMLLTKDCDLVALASTGSGKTAAFGIPLIEKIDGASKSTQALILCPTRELAVQVSEQLQNLGRFKNIRVATIYGGASYIPQEKALHRGAQIIVATPGRLIDFMEKGLAKLENLQTLVLDEADEMISMGFQEDLEMILKASSADSRKWLFSATMSKQIRSIAAKYLKTPESITINTSGGLSTTIEQIYYTVKINNKLEALTRILKSSPDFYGIVFCQTKLEVANIAERLASVGFLVDALHGDRSQTEREITLKKFRTRKVSVLVATDVAARGLDVKELTHVVNLSLPRDVESYIHRIGRTARNGMAGIALSLVSPDQVRRLADIQRATKVKFVRGRIPSNDEVALIGVKRALENVRQSNTTRVTTIKRLQTLIEKVSSEQAWDWTDVPVTELLARLISPTLSIDLGSGAADDLDYLPQHITPRELSGESRPPARFERFKGNWSSDSGRDGDRGRNGRSKDFRPERTDRSERFPTRYENSERPPRTDRFPSRSTGAPRQEYSEKSVRPTLGVRRASTEERKSVGAEGTYRKSTGAGDFQKSERAERPKFKAGKPRDEKPRRKVERFPKA